MTLYIHKWYTKNWNDSNKIKNKRVFVANFISLPIVTLKLLPLQHVFLILFMF